MGGKSTVLTCSNVFLHVCGVDIYRSDVVALTFFRLTFLRMRNTCKIINVQRKDKVFVA